MPERAPRDLSGADPLRAFWAAHEMGQRIMVRTSGTAQNPRAVVRTTQSWVDSFPDVSRLTGISGQSRLWVPGPLSATMNLFAHLHAQWAGATAGTAPRGATHAVLTPLSCTRALRDGLLAGGVIAIVAGDCLPPSTVLAARTSGVTVHHYYGASELSFVAWGSDGAALKPFPAVEVQIVEGLVWARSPYLSDGYATSATAGPWRVDADGYASVGDHGALIHGDLVVHGRHDEGVTTAGMTVIVADIEAVLRPAAQGSILVVGIPDARLGAIVVAVLTDPADVDSLVAVAGAGLSPAQRPRRWYVLPEFPMTPAGKPDREFLVQMVTKGGATRVGR